MSVAGWKRLFLEWTARDLLKSWSKGTRAFVNMHTAMYMYEPSEKYPIAHPRAFTACSLAGDPQLYERFCCWACRRQSDEGEVKSLWPSMTSFTNHWHIEHASALQTEWMTLALWGNVSIQDLAWEILGVDLEETPLPRAPAALPTIPKVMPDPRIYGSPWYARGSLLQGFTSFSSSTESRVAILECPQCDFTLSTSTSTLPLLAVNKSLMASTSTSCSHSREHAKSPSVTLKAAPRTKTKVPLPPSSSTPSSQAPKDKTVASEDEPFVTKPAQVQQDGSRFQATKPWPGFTLMGWENPIMLWAHRLQPQIRNFTHPCPSIRDYSHAREDWHQQNCKPPSLRTWLLCMEEHSFYLLTIKCVASVSLKSRSRLSVKDRRRHWRCALWRSMTCEMSSLPSNLSDIPTLYSLTSLLLLNIARRSSTLGCQWMLLQLSPWPLHGLLTTCPSMMNGRGPCTRNCDSFTCPRSGALLYGCSSCLDLMFGYTLFYRVLTRLFAFLLEFVLPCLFTFISFIFLSALLNDLLFALLVSCILFHFSIANVHLPPPSILTPSPVGLVVFPFCLAPGLG